LPAVGDVAEIGAEFFFDRRAGDAFDQQIDNQTPRLNYLLSTYSESVAQAQSLCLYLQEFFERDETLRRIRLILNLTQLLARVTLNCGQINLHLICAACAEVTQAGRQRREGKVKPLQCLCLLAFAAFRPFRRLSKNPVELDKSVAYAKRAHIFVMLRTEAEGEIPPAKYAGLFTLIITKTFARNGCSHFQPAERAAE
jgi:hypothetical protein